MFIDSHAHLTSDALFPHLEELLSRAKEAGVEAIVNICTDALTLERGLALAETTPWISNTGATTPHDVHTEGEKLFPLFEKAARDGKLAAIGETGLDYYYEHSDRELQKKFLIRYFHLALDTGLPVVIHCREAFPDLFDIADRHYKTGGKSGPLLLHCFTGTSEEAAQALHRGWLISLSGILTFKKSGALRHTALEVPIEHLLIETDSPYLAPQSCRGKTCEPAYVVETAKTLSTIKDLPLAEIARITAQNAKAFFRL